jgi:muramoyltetrapeptide carboxypeptidase
MTIKSLQKGDTVIIISPAGRVLPAHIDNAVQYLENWGLNVLVSPSAKGQSYNFSGTIEERLSDLQWALNHQEAKAIFCSRGGYGAIHLLDKVDWSAFQKNPKWLIGYSDVTNLHAQVNRMEIPSVHGLMPNSFPKVGEENESSKTLFDFLFADNYSLEWESHIPVSDATVKGEIIGGNLSILYSLQGTPYAPDYEGKILFIEDLGEYLYHFDRILNNFKLSGIFSQVKGIIVGEFSDVKDNENPFGKSIEEIILDATKDYNIPVVFGLKTGHGKPTLALPFGVESRLEIQNNKCSLYF